MTGRWLGVAHPRCWHHVSMAAGQRTATTAQRLTIGPGVWQLHRVRVNSFESQLDRARLDDIPTAGRSYADLCSRLEK